jgi:integrase
MSELPAQLADMAAFTLATGLRQSGVSWLRREQVDLKLRAAGIHADQSKSRRATAVPLNEDAMRTLKQSRGLARSEAYLAAGRVDGTNLARYRQDSSLWLIVYNWNQMVARHRIELPTRRFSAPSPEHHASG